MEASLLQELARQAAMLFKLGTTDAFVPQCVKIRFDQHTIVALNDSHGAVLLIACERQTNAALIINTVNTMCGNSFV
jgi:hypothetical protein